MKNKILSSLKTISSSTSKYNSLPTSFRAFSYKIENPNLLANYTLNDNYQRQSEIEERRKKFRSENPKQIFEISRKGLGLLSYITLILIKNTLAAARMERVLLV